MLPLVDKADLVTASPYHPLGLVRNVPAWRLFLSKSLSRLYSAVLRERIFTYTSCCRVYRRSRMRRSELRNGGFLGTAEMLIRLKAMGGRIVEVPATLESRLLGESKMKIVRTIGGHLGLLAGLDPRQDVVVSRPSPSEPASFDLDNHWSYMKTHGDSGWETLPLVPRHAGADRARALRAPRGERDVLRGRPGRGARDEPRRARRAGAAGTRDRQPLLLARALVSRVRPAADRAGDPPRRGADRAGHRAAAARVPRPGLLLSSADAVRVLSERGYAYDASTLPTFLGPLARAYYFWTSRDMPAEERRHAQPAVRLGLRTGCGRSGPTPGR